MLVGHFREAGEEVATNNLVSIHADHLKFLLYLLIYTNFKSATLFSGMIHKPLS